MQGNLVILTRVPRYSHRPCSQHTDQRSTAGILIPLTQAAMADTHSWNPCREWRPVRRTELRPSTLLLSCTASLRAQLSVITLRVIVEAAGKANCLAHTQPLPALLHPASAGKSEMPVITYKESLYSWRLMPTNRFPQLMKRRNPSPRSAWPRHRGPSDRASPVSPSP